MQTQNFKKSSCGIISKEKEMDFDQYEKLQVLLKIQDDWKNFNEKHKTGLRILYGHAKHVAE